MKDFDLRQRTIYLAKNRRREQLLLQQENVSLDYLNRNSIGDMRYHGLELVEIGPDLVQVFVDGVLLAALLALPFQTDQELLQLADHRAGHADAAVGGPVRQGVIAVDRLVGDGAGVLRLDEPHDKLAVVLGQLVKAVDGLALKHVVAHQLA